MTRAVVISLIIIALSVAVTLYYYPHLPDNIPSHWNAAGDINGYMPRIWAVSLIPVITLLMLGLFVLLPKIDPLKRNWPAFRKYYDGMIVVFVLFMSYIHMLVLVAGLGMDYNMVWFMVPAISVLFYYTGILLGNARRNWFGGIKTPWTLSSDRVWNKTHRIGGKMFRASAVIALAGMAFGEWVIWFVIVPALFTAAYTVVYSYVEYRRERK